MSRFRLLLFDRDGTLTFENKDYHTDLNRLRPYPFVKNALGTLKEQGYIIGVITNQSGIGRGLWTLAEVEEAHLALNRAWNVDLQYYICPHHPDEGCDCRKPKPLLIQKAMDEFGVAPSETLMIGDQTTDLDAAKNADVSAALVLTGKGRAIARGKIVAPDFIINNVAELAMII